MKNLQSKRTANSDLVPIVLREMFDRFNLLTSDEEKDKFWEEVKKDNQLSTEILNRALKQGLLLLSDQVNTLSQKVKAQMSA